MAARTPATIATHTARAHSSSTSSTSTNSSYTSLALAAASGIAVTGLACFVYQRLTRPQSKPRTAAATMSAPTTFTKKPMVVTVTGAAGQIGYSIIFMIAGGRMLGADQPIELRLLDIPPMKAVVDGVMMELEDCAFPLLTKVVGTSDYREAFEGTQVALLIGARPRGPGMDRKDLLKANASIFEGQGKALDQWADRGVKVLVVGNPANTNALITRHFAPSLPASAFTAMTRLDQNRAKAQLAKKAGVSVGTVRDVIVWGNHSNTQYPDVNHATVSDKPVSAVIGDSAWLQGEFIKNVQTRGAAIIDALKKSSAASAANAAVEHVRDWVLGSDEIVSMAVISDGNSYGVPSNLCFSFPVRCNGGKWTIVDGLSIDDFSRQKLTATADELIQERKDALGE